MYEIKGTSWHWKLVSRYGFYRWNSRVSLCRYFWTVVGCVIREVFLWPFRKPRNFVTFPVLVIVLYLVPVFYFFYGTLWGRSDDLFLAITFVLGGAETALTVLAALVYSLLQVTGTEWANEAGYQIRDSRAVRAVDDGIAKADEAVVDVCDSISETLFSDRLALITMAVLIFLFYVIPVSTVVICWNDVNQPKGDLANWGLAILFAIGLIDIFATFIAAACGLIFLMAFLTEEVFPRINKTVNGFETYRLVAAFLRAKKERVCPLLSVPKNSN